MTSTNYIIIQIYGNYVLVIIIKHICISMCMRMYVYTGYNRAKGIYKLTTVYIYTILTSILYSRSIYIYIYICIIL